MFARVVEFSPTSEAASQLARVIEETALRMVKAQAGCVAALVQLRGQVVMGVSVWESTSDAERHSRECYPDIENMLRPFLKCDPEIHTFEERENGACMSSKQVTELRKYPRLPISFPLFARGVDASGKPFKALLTALNVSASGILVLTSSKLIPARHLKIELPVGVVAQEARQTSHEVHAEIVRVAQLGRSKLVGLRFGRRIA